MLWLYLFIYKSYFVHILQFCGFTQCFCTLCDIFSEFTHSLLSFLVNIPSFFLSSDKTVKIWLSKVWRKRWDTKWLWISRLAAASSSDPWPAHFKQRRVTLKFSTAMGALNIHTHLWLSWRKTKLSDFLYCQFLKVPLRCGATQNCISVSVRPPGQTPSHETPPQPGIK